LPGGVNLPVFSCAALSKASMKVCTIVVSKKVAGKGTGNE
jgi:hypothetical protein